MKLKKRYILSLAVAAVMLLTAVVSEGISRSLTGRLLHQTAAERYETEDSPYKQVSVFFSSAAPFSAASVTQVQESIDTSLRNHSIQSENPDVKIWYDAWSTDKGLVSADGSKESGVTCAATLIGGDFFEIHAMRLMDGSYIRPDDLMKDRVVIDTITAWNTYGSSEIAGMKLTIDGIDYLIAGVVEPEQNSDTQRVYGTNGRIYMPYPAASTGNASDLPKLSVSAADSVSCYEAVIPNPVRNFAKEQIVEAFKMQKNVQILVNTDRNSVMERWQRFWHLRDMAISENGISYPWWENSARLRDFTAALLFGLECLLLLFPIFCLFAAIWKLYHFLSALIARKMEAHKRKYRTIEKDPYAL